MAKSSFDVITGKLVSGEGTAKCYAFHSPHAESLRVGKKEWYLSECLRDEPSLGVKGSMSRFPSRNNIQPQIGGEFWQTSYTIEEGEVIKMFVQSSIGDTWMSPNKTASVFLRIRSEAALVRLSIKAPSGCPDASSADWYALGRFDVLSEAEADEIGINIPENARGQFSGSGWDALFEAKVISPEIKPKKVVQVEKVGDRIMRTTRPRRSFGN